MKHLSKAFLAAIMALLLGTLFPVQVFADTPDYISEIKIFAGDYSAAQGEGYTLLKDGKNPVDLNQNAGGGWGSKGEKSVYLGYKTTTERSEAITDLALMNMKGGYDVAEYKALMNAQMNSQILPLIDNFRKTINEYRANYVSKNKANKERAKYIHDALNKLIDDDTGKPLGDLLLKKTKEEMGDEAYNALSDEEKKQHADLSTIIAQSNGQATLMMENLVTRASDTNTNTWVDRLSKITYEKLADSTGLTPTDAAKKLAKLYDDAANTILTQWNDLRAELKTYDAAVKKANEYVAPDLDAMKEELDSLDSDSSYEEYQNLAEEYGAALKENKEIANCTELIAIHDMLSSVKYGEGTLLDFFTQDTEEVEGDITALYPIVASLTEGQKAGLEFVSLREFMLISMTDAKGYRSAEFDKIEEISIYDGVDRNIYNQGGVALTNETFRKKAMTAVAEENSKLSGWTIALIAITGACFVALAGSAISWAVYASKLRGVVKTINLQLLELEMAYPKSAMNGKWTFKEALGFTDEETQRLYKYYPQKTAMCKYMTFGFAAAMVVLAGISTYLAWEDMKAYYKVDFTPIPHYMVDEKDLIGYNSKGEKIVLKNQMAYYKAVECNRKSGDEYFEVVGTCADMNGDVGRQWLALYAAKNEIMEPIMAESLKVVVGKADIPAGYEKGIHMFGTEAAFNLNSSLYDWNNEAPTTYIYFKTDSDAVSNTTGTYFTAGTLALAGGTGLAIGAVVTGICMLFNKKRKENKTQTA